MYPVLYTDVTMARYVIVGSYFEVEPDLRLPPDTTPADEFERLRHAAMRRLWMRMMRHPSTAGAA